MEKRRLTGFTANPSRTIVRCPSPPATSFTDPLGKVHPYAGSMPDFCWWGDRPGPIFSITCSTANMTGIQVSYGCNNMTAAPNVIDTLEYSLDGATWTSIAGANMPTYVDQRVTNDLSGVAALNNQPTVTLRWRCAAAPPVSASSSRAS